MPARKGLLAPQNTFLDTIATRFDGTRKYTSSLSSLKPNNYIKYFVSSVEFKFFNVYEIL